MDSLSVDVSLSAKGDGIGIQEKLPKLVTTLIQKYRLKIFLARLLRMQLEDFSQKKLLK
jgi:hypothetical protein